MPNQNILIDSNNKLLLEITERKRVEERLAKQANFMKLMFETTDTTSNISDFKQALQYCLNTICKNIGWPVGHAYLPKPTDNNILIPSDIWYLEDKEQNNDFYNMTMNMTFRKGEGLPGLIMEHGKPLWIEDIQKFCYYQQAVPEIKLYSAIGFPIKVANKIVAVLELFNYKIKEIDEELLLSFNVLSEQLTRIFERQQAQKSLKQAEKKFRDLLEGAPDAIIILNTEGAIILVNAQTEKMFGYSRSELLGRNIELLIPEQFSNKYYSTKNTKLNAPNKKLAAISFELEGKNKNNINFPVEINLAPVEINEGILTLATIRDISERKRIENMKDEFISIVSHELRTPLTSIYGAIELLSDGDLQNEKEKASKLLSIAKNNSKRLIRLINDILDLEKIDSGRMNMRFTVINLNLLIAEAITINQPYADKLAVKVNYSLPCKNMMIQSDRDRLMQVITNLISNAFKFSPPNSIVKIHVAHTTLQKIRIEIIDQGPGIPEKFHPHVFEKFRQADSSTSREYAGTGLGLSISKSIIEKLNGEIGFTTKDNNGTTFYFEIPIHYH